MITNTVLTLIGAVGNTCSLGEFTLRQAAFFPNLFEARADIVRHKPLSFSSIGRKYNHNEIRSDKCVVFELG